MSLFDLVEDGFGGCDRVGGAGDGATDYEHGGSGGDRAGRGGDALLVFDGGPGGADSGDDQEGVGTGLSSEQSYFFGGADHTVDTGLLSELREAKDLIGGGVH